MTQKHHVMHGRDHSRHGADPIQGVSACAWINCGSTSVLFSSLSDGATGLAYKVTRFDISSGDVIQDSIGLSFSSGDVVLAQGGIYMLRCTSRPNMPAQTATRRLRTYFSFTAGIHEIPATNSWDIIIPLANGGPVVLAIPGELSVLTDNDAAITVQFWENTGAGTAASGVGLDLLIQRVDI